MQFRLITLEHCANFNFDSCPDTQSGSTYCGWTKSCTTWNRGMNIPRFQKPTNNGFNHGFKVVRWHFVYPQHDQTSPSVEPNQRLRMKGATNSQTWRRMSPTRSARQTANIQLVAVENICLGNQDQQNKSNTYTNHMRRSFSGRITRNTLARIPCFTLPPGLLSSDEIRKARLVHSSRSSTSPAPGSVRCLEVTVSVCPNVVLLARNGPEIHPA